MRSLQPGFLFPRHNHLCFAGVTVLPLTFSDVSRVAAGVLPAGAPGAGAHL